MPHPAAKAWVLNVTSTESSLDPGAIARGGCSVASPVPGAATHARGGNDGAREDSSQAMRRTQLEKQGCDEPTCRKTTHP